MRVTHGSSSHHTSCLVNRRHENGEERVLFLEVGVFCGFGLCLQLFSQYVSGICLCRFCFLSRSCGCFSIVFAVDPGYELVCLIHVLENLRSLVGSPEFEGCSTLKEFPDTFRFLHTRQFHEDTAGVADFLYVRLGDAETVHPVSEDFE